VAQQPKKPCKECNALANGPFCEKHQQLAHQNSREYDAHRRKNDPFRKLYNTARWRNDICPLVLARDIVCRSGVLCTNPDTGIRAFATECDHVIPARVYVAQHGGDTNSFFDETNLQGLCSRCHKSKTAEERVRYEGSAVPEAC